MTDTADNPMGLDGFAFVEFTSPDPDAMVAWFEKLGFTQDDVTLEGHAIEARVYAEDSFGGFLPLVAGTDAGPVMSGFQDVAELPERLFNDPDNRLDLAARDPWISAMQGFFLGQTDEAATKTALQQIWMEGATRLCADQGYEWCPA